MDNCEQLARMICEKWDEWTAKSAEASALGESYEEELVRLVHDCLRVWTAPTVFKFGIGSFVKQAISAEQVPAEEKSFARLLGHYELRGQVVERKMVECPGGVQRIYAVRWVRYDGHIHGPITMHNEIELVESQPFPAVEEPKGA